jgi:hypothetical protein
MARLHEEKLNVAKSHRHGLYYTSIMALGAGVENGQAELFMFGVYLVYHYFLVYHLIDDSPQLPLKKDENNIFPKICSNPFSYCLKIYQCKYGPF